MNKNKLKILFSAILLPVSLQAGAVPVLPVPVPAKGQTSTQMGTDKTACYA